LLARGALLSPFKRPAPDAQFPRTRLVLPALRAEIDGPFAALPDWRDCVPLPGFRFAPAWPAGPLRSPA
ncbi:hypothetical protein AB0G90_36795, partial [Streptomyces coeruleorubidus]